MEELIQYPETTTGWILSGLLAVSTIYQLIYYITTGFVLRKKNKANNASATLPAVSVIICARNESENLKNHIPQIIKQKYPNFEVIVVNDSSSDDSDMILAQLKTQYPNLYYTTIPIDKKFVHTKKLAVNIGIKAAKNNLLLFTDADCMPASENWITEMVKGYNPDTTEIVLGYSPYQKEKGLLNLLIRYDAFWNGVQYLSMAANGHPFMGVGRNLLYTKNLFLKNNGFSKHIYLYSGDDDLFVNETANKQNTSIVTTADSQTISLAPATYLQWLNQKSRHLTTAPLYKFSHKLKLFAETLSRQLVWTLSILSIIISNFAIIGISALILKISLQLLSLKTAAKHLDAQKIYWAALLFDFILPFILGSLYIRNMFRSKQIKWK